MPLTPAAYTAPPMSPSVIATVMNETREISGNYSGAVSLVDAVRLVAANRRRDCSKSEDNNSSLNNSSKVRSRAPPLSPTSAKGNNDEGDGIFHSCRSSSVSSSSTSTPSKRLLLDVDADDENDEVDAQSAAGSHSSRYNLQAAEQVYKTPFPNCYVTVVQDRMSGLCHIVVQGTGDMLADIVTYYWNGVEMKLLTESERIRIRDFYTRQSLTAFASAFAYKSLANAAKLANILDERCGAGLDCNIASDSNNNSSSKGDLIFELPNVTPRPLSPSSYMEQILSAARSGAVGSGGISALDADILEACLGELIFVGASMFQYQSRNSFVHTIELLQQGCIRFIHFSRENELRSRAFAERLGLESGWNCHVCLDSEAVDPHAATTLLEHKAAAAAAQQRTALPVNTTTRVNTSRPPATPVNTGNTVPPPLTTSTRHNRQRRSTNVSKVSNMSELQPPKQQHRPSVTSSTSHRSVNTTTVIHTTRQHVASLTKMIQAASRNPGQPAPSTSHTMDPRGVAAASAVAAGGVRSPGGVSVSISESTSAPDSTDQNVMPNFDWYNRSGLPKGIENIREHLDKIDNVPLLVPLFTDCKQSSAQEMIKIMQENGEIVCTIGSAACQWNASVFGQSDSAVAIEPLHAEHCAVRAYLRSAGGGRIMVPNTDNNDTNVNDADDEAGGDLQVARKTIKQQQTGSGAARQAALRHRLSNVRWSRSHEIPLYVNQSGGNSQNASSVQLNASINTTPVHRVNFSSSSAAAGAAPASAANILQSRTRQRNRQQQQQSVHKRITQGMMRGGGGSSGSLGKAAMAMKDLRHRKSASGNNLLPGGDKHALDGSAVAVGSSRRSSVDPASSSSATGGVSQRNLVVNRRVSMIAGGLTAKPSALRSPFKKNSSSISSGSRYQHLEQQHQYRISTTTSPRYAEQARQMMKRKLQALHLPTTGAARRPHQHHYNMLNRSSETVAATTTKKSSYFDNNNNEFLASAASRDLRTSPQDIANHINSLNCALKLHADEPFCLITLIMQSRHFMSVLRNCLLFMASCQLFLFLSILLSRLVLMPYPLSLGQLMFVIFVIIPLLCVGIMASPQERQQMKYPTSKNNNLMRWPVVRRYLSTFARRWLPSLCVCCLLFLLLCLQHCQPTYDAVYAVDEASVTENNWKSRPFYAHNTSGSFASCYPRLTNIQSPDIAVSAAQLIVFFEICMCFVVISASYLNPYHTMFSRSPFRNRWWLFCAVVAVALNVLFVIGDQGLYMLRSSSQTTDGFGVGALVWSDAWQEQASLGHDKKVALAVQVLVWSITCIWPIVLLVVNEVLKKQDIARHEKRQKRARLQFNTKLGQYSPV